MSTESTCLLYPGHWNRKAQEAEIIQNLWEPRPVSNQKLTISIKNRIASLYQYGYNISEIAEWFYQGKSKTRKIILEQGVAIRRGRLRYNITESEWEAKKAEYNNRCAYCGRKSKQLTVEHIIPLSSGGEDELANIIPACIECNRSKNNSALRDWKLFKGLQLNLDQIT